MRIILSKALIFSPQRSRKNTFCTEPKIGLHLFCIKRQLKNGKNYGQGLFIFGGHLHIYDLQKHSLWFKKKRLCYRKKEKKRKKKEMKFEINKI